MYPSFQVKEMFYLNLMTALNIFSYFVIRMIQFQTSLLVSVNVKPTPKAVSVMPVRMAFLTSKQVTQLVVFHVAAHWMVLKTETVHVTQLLGSVTAKTE